MSARGALAVLPHGSVPAVDLWPVQPWVLGISGSEHCPGAPCPQKRSTRALCACRLFLERKIKQ